MLSPGASPGSASLFLQTPLKEYNIYPQKQDGAVLASDELALFIWKEILMLISEHNASKKCRDSSTIPPIFGETK